MIWLQLALGLGLIIVVSVGIIGSVYLVVDIARKLEK